MATPTPVVLSGKTWRATVHGAQPRGPHQQPIAYLSRELDVISRGWPHCLRVIGATALLTPEALKLIQYCKV